MNSFYAGAISGVISYTAVYPLEVIRSKLSVNIDSQYKNYNNFYSIMICTYKNNGLIGFYKGWKISSIGMIPYQGITYFIYKNVRFFEKGNKYNGLFTGSFAGFSAVSITYPFDVIKRKYHLTGEMGNKKYINYADIIKTTYKMYGIKGFYTGLFSCYIKIIPSSAIFFFTIDLLKK